MKKIIVIHIVALIYHISPSQNFDALANYEFKAAESYKSEELKVLECANYLFNNPADKVESNRLASVQYIMKWMMGTPDYTFDIGPKATELTNGSPDFLGLYLAAMAKVVLENNDEALNKDQIHNQSETILVEYCSKPENNIKPNKAIKKIIKSRKS
jgi:hypothetical protein